MKYYTSFLVTAAACLLTISYCAAQANSTQIIRGTVTNSETGGGIEGANIYLANTSIGTSTNSYGEYELKTEASGDYTIVYSIIGYTRKVFTLRINKGAKLRNNVALKPQVIELQEVKVVSSNKAWKRDYDFFLREFIGETDFAKQTTIENPWVLDFKDGEGNNLIATSKEPIIIENLALGYKLHLELVEFFWNRNGHGGAYQIFPRYEELHTDNELQKQIWKINRWKTFYGSLPHFLGSLYHEKLEAEHFDVKTRRSIEPLSKGETKFELIGKAGLSPGKRDQLKGYKINKVTEISFSHTLRVKLTNSTLKVPIKKEAKISPNTENELFFVDRNGSLLHPTSLKVYGVWARNRVANSLPTNYSPNVDQVP